MLEAADSMKSIGKHCKSYLNQYFLLITLFFALNSNTYLPYGGLGASKSVRERILFNLTTNMLPFLILGLVLQ